MSTAEILAELPRLTPDELAKVQAKLDELTGETWHAYADLSDADRQTLDGTLAAYAASPNAGDSWDAVKARARAKLRP